MWRVLKIGAALMGILLMLITASLWVLRASNPPPRRWLIWWERDYYWLVEGDLTPRNANWGDDIFLRWSSDKQWMYFAAPFGGGDGGSPLLTIYRMRPSGHDKHAIADRIVNFQWTADGEWLLYTAYTEKGWILFRVRANGQERLNLHDGLPLLVDECVVAPDGKTVYFSGIAHLEPERPINLYRVNWDGSGLIQLNDSRQPMFYVLDVTSDGEWLIVKIGLTGQLARMRADGSEWYTLSPEALAYQRYMVQPTLLPGDIMVFETQDFATHAVHIQDGHELWGANHLIYSNIAPESEWVYGWFIGPEPQPYVNTRVFAFKADGSQQIEAQQDVPFYGRPLGRSSDDQWLYYSVNGHLIRARTDFSQSDMLGKGEYLTLSKDYIYYFEYGAWQGDFRDATLYRMRMDGSARQAIAHLLENQFAHSEGWGSRLTDGPRLESRWRPINLLLTTPFFVVIVIGLNRKVRGSRAKFSVTDHFE